MSTRPACATRSGTYADPVDAYGRLCMEQFQAGRLVGDTGMNVLGWTRERAEVLSEGHCRWTSWARTSRS